MKKLIINLSVCSLIAAVAISSCKKNNNNKTTTSPFVGVWMQHEYTYDANNNGVVDDSVVNMDNSQIKMTIKSDGTGEAEQIGVKYADFTWSVSGSYFVSVSTTIGTAGMLVTSGPSTSLTWKDTTKGRTAWVTFNKQ